MTSTTSLRRPAHATQLFGVLFALLLALPAWANDNDPDWGLPGPIQSPTGASEDSHFALAVSGSFEAADLAPTTGTIDLSVDGTDAFGLEASDASSDPLVIAHPSGLRHHAVEGGQALQGAADLLLGDGFHATLHAPSDSLGSVAFLTLDFAPAGLEGLVANGGLGIWSIVPLGQVDAFDLEKFQKLVAAHAAALEGPYGATVGVSLIVLSIDAGGATHVTGARVTTDGGAVEVLAQ